MTDRDNQHVHASTLLTGDQNRDALVAMKDRVRTSSGQVLTERAGIVKRQKNPHGTEPIWANPTSQGNPLSHTLQTIGQVVLRWPKVNRVHAAFRAVMPTCVP